MPHHLAPERSRRPRAQVRPFDFRKPNKLNRDHVRNLMIVHETFARQFTTVVSSTLRAVSSVSVAAIEQLTYDDYVNQTPDPSHLSILSVSPLPGLALLQLPVPLVLTAVELMLGGHGRTAYPTRPLTEIETGLIRTIVDRAMREMAYAFDSIAKIEPSVVQHESNPQFAQIVPPTDMVVVVWLDLKVERAADRASLCFPYAMLQPVLEAASSNAAGGRDRKRAEVAKSRARLEERLREIDVELRVQFPPITLSSEQVLDLAPGDVISLGHDISRPLWGVVDDQRVLEITPGRRGKRLAAQVTDVVASPSP